MNEPRERSVKESGCIEEIEATKQYYFILFRFICSLFALKSVEYYSLDCIYWNVFVFIEALTIQRLFVSLCRMMCLLKPYHVMRTKLIEIDDWMVYVSTNFNVWTLICACFHSISFFSVNLDPIDTWSVFFWSIRVYFIYQPWCCHVCWTNFFACKAQHVSTPLPKQKHHKSLTVQIWVWFWLIF